MKKSSGFADLFMPWAGLVAGVVAAGVVHQFGSEATFDHCAVISPGPLLIVALIGLAVTAAGALASYRVFRGSAETAARKVIAVISLGSAALFLFAIVLPMIASLVLPPCFQ
jgi:hypothetical protein